MSTTLVFHTTHAHVSFFVTEPRTINIRFAAYSPALPFTLYRQRSHSPTFVHSLPRYPIPKLTAFLYTTNHPYHPILTFRNDLLVRCVIAFAFQNPAHTPVHRIFPALHFRSRSSCISHSYSITFAYLSFSQSIFGPSTAIT